MGQFGDYAMGNNFEQILAQLAAQHEPPPQPTAKHVRDTLPRVTVPAAAAAAATEAEVAASVAADCLAPAAAVKAGDTCAVCHDEYQEGAVLTAVPGCMHCFHGDCIMPWLEEVRCRCSVTCWSLHPPNVLEPRNVVHDVIRSLLHLP